MKNLILSIIILFPIFAEAITITDIKIRPAIGQGYPSTIYLNIENDSDQLDYLLGVEVVDHPETKVTINKTVIEKNIVRIIKIDRLAIPTYSKINLAPLGIYIVISDLNFPHFVKLRFTFKNAGEIVVMNNAPPTHP